MDKSQTKSLIPRNPPSPYIKNQLLTEDQEKRRGGVSQGGESSTGKPCGFLPFLEEQVDEELPSSEEQKLWQWGMDGLKNFTFPCRISQIEASGAHVLALTSAGNVYVWGRQGSGAPVLGFGSAVVEARFPKLIPSLQNIKSVACGEVTSGAITQEGKLYLWGDPLLAKAYYWSQPTLFLPLKDNKISKVALGDQYAIAIAIRGPLPEDTQLLSWGYAKEGVLGHTEFTNVDQPQTPMPIKGLEGKRVIDVSVGKNHCACCNVEGKVWTWGRNHTPQGPVLGTRDRSPILWIPNVVVFPREPGVESPRILRVHCGNSVTFAQTDEGKLFSWGSDKYCKGSLGLGPDCSYTPYPTFVSPPIKGQKIVHVAVGGEHVMVSFKTGALSTFGTGKGGQLKIAGKEVLFQSSTVPMKNQELVLNVACNFRNVFAIVAPDKAKLVCGKQQEIFSVHWHRKLDHLYSYISDRYQSEVPSPFLLFDQSGKRISNPDLFQVVAEMQRRELPPVFYAVSIQTLVEKEEGEHVIFDKHSGCLSKIHKKNLFQALSGSLLNSLLNHQDLDGTKSTSSFLNKPNICPPLPHLELQDGLLFFAPLLFEGISAHCILDRLISLYFSFSFPERGEKPFDLFFWKPFFVQEDERKKNENVLPNSYFWVLERQNRILAALEVWFDRFPLDFCLKSEGEKQYLIEKLLDFLSLEEHRQGNNWEKVTKLRQKIMLQISVIQSSYCESQVVHDFEEAIGDGRRRNWVRQEKEGEDEEEGEEHRRSSEQLEEGNFMLEMDSPPQEHEQKEKKEGEPGEKGEKQEDNEHQEGEKGDRESDGGKSNQKEDEKEVEEEVTLNQERQQDQTLDPEQQHRFFQGVKELFEEKEVESLLVEGEEDLELVACHPQTLANQLTMFDEEFILRSISPREIVEWYCKKATKPGEQVFGGEANCIGLKRAIVRIGRVTDWVEKEIICCSQERRIAVVSVALETANRLMKLQNYFSFGCFYMAFHRSSVLYATQNVWASGAGLSPDFRSSLEEMRSKTQNGLFSSDFLAHFAELPLPKIPFYPVYLVMDKGILQREGLGEEVLSPLGGRRSSVTLGHSRGKEEERKRLERENENTEEKKGNRGERSIGDEVVIWEEMRWMTQLSIWLNSFSKSSYSGLSTSNFFLRKLWTLRGFHYSPFIHSHSIEGVVSHMKLERKGDIRYEGSKLWEFDIEMFSVVLKDLVDEEHQVTDRWFLFPDKRIFESRNQIFSTMTAMALNQTVNEHRLDLWRGWEKRLQQESKAKAKHPVKDQSADLYHVYFPFRSILRNSNGLDLALVDLIENPASPAELPVIHSTLSLFWGGAVNGRELARALSSLKHYQLSEDDKNHLQKAIEMIRKVGGLLGEWALAQTEFVNTLSFLLNDVEPLVPKLEKCEKIVSHPKSLFVIQSDLKVFVPTTFIPQNIEEEDILWLLFCWSLEQLHWFSTSNFYFFPKVQAGILSAKKSLQSLGQTITLTDVNNELSQRQKELDWITLLEQQLDQDEKAFEHYLSQWEDNFSLENEKQPSLTLTPHQVKQPPSEIPLQSLDGLIKNLHRFSQAELETKVMTPFHHFAEKGFQQLALEVNKATSKSESFGNQLAYFVKILGRIVLAHLLLKIQDDLLKSSKVEVFSTVERIVGTIEKKYGLSIQHRLKTSLANIINQLPKEKMEKLIEK